jgi:hypothetical protein
MSDQSWPTVGATVTGQAASVIQIESAKLAPLILVLSVLCGLSIAAAAFAMNQAQTSERETRLLEYYVMELDGKLMSKGVIEPSRSWSAQKQERSEK